MNITNKSLFSVISSERDHTQETDSASYHSNSSIKSCKPHRLIIELFNLSLTFMDQFFDTYPIFMDSRFLLKTLINIYKNEEKISDADDKDIVYDSPSQSPSDVKKAETIESIPAADTTSISSKNVDQSFNENGKFTQTNDGDSINHSLPSPNLFKTIKSTNMQSKCTPLSQNDVRNNRGICRRSGNSLNSPGFMTAELVVLKILSHWITKYFVDFKENSGLKEEVETFLTEILGLESSLDKKSSIYTRANMLKNTLHQSSHNLDGRSVHTLFNIESLFIDIQFSENTKSQEIEEYNPTFVAYGFTDISITVQKNINVRELLGIVWTKKDKEKRAPTILLITENFNKTTQLIKQHILVPDKSKKRAKRIEFWLEVAQELLILENYSVISMIMGAIESNAVYRLNKTWMKVNRKAKSIREKLLKLVDPLSNYSALRKKYTNENFIPFLGPFLTELCYIEERNTSSIANEYVNFKKMKSISKVISSVRKSMNYKFLTPSHQGSYIFILRFIRDNPMPEKDIQARSLKVEPISETADPSKSHI